MVPALSAGANQATGPAKKLLKLMCSLNLWSQRHRISAASPITQSNPFL